MKPYYEDEAVTIYHSDCREFDGSADVIITDPPYGLEFMGKGWDKGVPTFWDFDAGWLFAFGGTRTWHRLACAIEDSGWQIRDTMMWLYGQGFPKGKNTLKPAWEPIIVARKYGDLDIDAARIGHNEPLVETLRTADKFGRTHAGGNGWRGHPEEQKLASPNPLGRWPANLILECTCKETLEGGDDDFVRNRTDGARPFNNNGKNTGYTTVDKVHGKCVIHTDPNCPCRLLDEQSGECKGMAVNVLRRGATTGKGLGYGSSSPVTPVEAVGYGDTGGASRFFYCAKASRGEREEGLYGVQPCAFCGGLTSKTHVNKEGLTVNCIRNDHPTVKPLSLMEYLITLSGGQTILDPFCGSGTTLVAAKRLGRKAIGIEIDEHSCEIARHRVSVVKRRTRYPSML